MTQSVKTMTDEGALTKSEHDKTLEAMAYLQAELDADDARRRKRAHDQGLAEGRREALLDIARTLLAPDALPELEAIKDLDDLSNTVTRKLAGR